MWGETQAGTGGQGTRNSSDLDRTERGGFNLSLCLAIGPATVARNRQTGLTIRCQRRSHVPGRAATCSRNTNRRHCATK
jgi:hypothetical protein